MPWSSGDVTPLVVTDPGHAVDLALTRRVELDRTGSVTEHLIGQARRQPDRPAVEDRRGTTTYLGLLQDATRIVDCLAAEGVRPGDVVAVVGPRNGDTIAILLALEGLGAVYLPLDPSWPRRRCLDILDDSRASALVRHAPGSPEAEAAAATAGIPVLDPRSRWGAKRTSVGTSRAVPDAEPRYLLYTSGTTGEPKGAVVEQRGMLNHLWAKVLDLGLTGEDRIAFTAPLVFGISIWQMLAGLLVGATVVVIDEADTLFPTRLRTALARSSVSVVELVPAMLDWLVECLRAVAENDRLPALRWLISTGEELLPAVARRAADVVPHARLLNAYGLTECSDDVAHHEVRGQDLDAVRLPIGTPVANAALYVLTDDGGSWRAARQGEAGELFVGGVGVGAGYTDAATTRRAFHADPFDPFSPTGRVYRTGDLAVVRDGLLYYLGRADRQIKLAGHRVELDEVEAILTRHEAIVGCAVAPTSDRSGLHAHYVARGQVTDVELRQFLRTVLSPIMIPKQWTRLPQLPLNANGKVDRRALALDNAVSSGNGGGCEVVGKQSLSIASGDVDP
ncbi:amino acid adenylation domain-containing protein [Allokutzneria oryzae]|uniref:Amino acid adenylation domain-containing protein n=1 Tax=Allokutzneria oryzae TaxID=1378989 RepID=A0ABV5ZXG2_9PSEU